ncbi:domain of unknown function family protein [Asticcacaulis biprosthecium C19]|uniref:Glycosyl transferase family 2 family protein n=1 Tax=Asticcacaulis biprosthecium C19 TaxID=715226 RepID=F4QL05_9CAUL|nr:glycosyltransferase family 2 protein [Asticcacaulis biprosthecium]EGF92228.1 domain of unknown function family protein [Asticcacaulis biprosthecium C19]
MTVAIIAIARNEGRFLTEWLAYHLRLGFDRIIVYDNESDDDSARILDTLSEEYPIQRIPWLSEPGLSPQIAAYNHALVHDGKDFDWVAFIDCDEFVVLHEDGDINDFLARYDDTISAVTLNWLTFGSSGRKTADYELVTDTFMTGPHKGFSNNLHVKTFARPQQIERMWIHHADLRDGRQVHASGKPAAMSEFKGVTDVIDHGIAHLNHYQVKSREDWDRKIARGRAGAMSDDPARVRTDGEEIWEKIDRPMERYEHMEARMPLFVPLYEQFRRILSQN